MCCCCKCCGKILKIVCSVIWIVVALILLCLIIIFAVAWGGSKVMQDVINNLVKCGIGQIDPGQCDQTFGEYVYGISKVDSFDVSCKELDNNSPDQEYKFGWKIFFDLEDKGLGVYARMSNKGIDKGNAEIFKIEGDLSETSKVFINVPPNDIDQDGNPITDPKKKYIIHDRYMHILAKGYCGLGTDCPAPLGGFYDMEVKNVNVHIRISFKTVPDFIAITIDNHFNYDDFVDVLYKIVKVFSKSAAEDMEFIMQNLRARVSGFQGQTLCPISKDYDPTLEQVN